MKEQKVCSKCNETKDIDLFTVAIVNKTGYTTRCKACSSKINRARYLKKQKEIEEGTYEKPRIREDRIVPYKYDTIEHDVWIHFYRMEIQLTDDQINYCVKKLRQAMNDNKYFNVMDKLEKEFGGGPEHYNVEFLNILRQGREIESDGRLNGSYAGQSEYVPINQYTLDGEFIKRYESIAIASLEITGSRTKGVGSICNCAKGVSYKALGFIFEYADKWEK